MTEISAAASGEFLIGGDLRVRRLGYGTMRLVGDGAWGEPEDAAAARQVLRRAVELGVNLIDTADAYGPEIAERLICEALHPYPAGLVIATKGGITRQGPAKTEYVGRAGYLIQCVEMSLRRLKVERIELYQLHRIDPRTPLEESLGALKQMQEQGKIRHVGLSEVTPEQIEEAEKIVPIVTVQNHYSLADRRHEETLMWCEGRGIGFLPWYPMAGGKLLQAEHPAASVAAQMAERHGLSVAQIALAWLLHRSPVMLPIPGTSKVAHLEENVKAGVMRITDREWLQLNNAITELP
ncbi:aldo/keto reductase [Terracidiphilus gabretensis]|uniref:aldo/keto reductase n=1 Tax=Terracidiphilus gabretensis TaxID=1577687 RepID=UPI00071B1834|nr:aldo/keto reductase [Terracidiphilus gabretensis]